MEAKKQPTKESPKTEKPAAVVATAAEPAAVEHKKTSGLAIAAIILAILVPVIGLILGIVALSSIKKNNEGGHGLAIAAIIVSIIMMIGSVLIFAAVIAGFNSALKKSGVDVSSGTVSVQGEDGESATFGNNTKLPDGFPSDVPVYEPSDVILSIKSKGRYNVTLASKDDSSQISSFYKTQLASKGWKQSDSEISFGVGVATSFTKGDQQLVLLIGSDKNAKNGLQSTINLTVGPKDSTE